MDQSVNYVNYQSNKGFEYNSLSNTKLIFELTAVNSTTYSSQPGQQFSIVEQ